MIVKVRTPNPKALQDTLVSLGGGMHVVDMDSYVDGVVNVESNNPGFLRFAITNQGYGEVVD